MMDSEDNCSDGVTLTERQVQALDLAKIAVKEIRKCNNTEPTTDDIFCNVILLMKLARKFTVNAEMSILDLRPACSFLTEVFGKNECSLGHIKKLFDQQEEYLNLFDDTGKNVLDDTAKNMWTKAVSYEECLVNANVYFANIEDPSEDLLNRFQNTFSGKEIASFLSTLQTEMKKLMSKTEKKAARQATAYVNMCCKITILHSFVLWQAFCIMNSSAVNKPSNEVVLAMINRSQNSNLNMLKCITEPEIQNAVFLSVFNITENENVKHFLQIQDIATQFYEQTYKIQWVYSPDVNIELRGYTNSFCGSTKHFDKFQFEYVEGREFDNVCYIRNVSRPGNPYIGIANDGLCRECRKESSTFKVKWKLISFGKNEKDRRFVLASADWPDRFLYLSSAMGCVTCRKNIEIDPLNVEKGLWKILEVEQATIKKR